MEAARRVNPKIVLVAKKDVLPFLRPLWEMTPEERRRRLEELRKELADED